MEKREGFLLKDDPNEMEVKCVITRDCLDSCETVVGEPNKAVHDVAAIPGIMQENMELTESLIMKKELCCKNIPNTMQLKYDHLQILEKMYSQQGNGDFQKKAADCVGDTNNTQDYLDIGDTVVGEPDKAGSNVATSSDITQENMELRVADSLIMKKEDLCSKGEPNTMASKCVNTFNYLIIGATGIYKQNDVTPDDTILPEFDELLIHRDQMVTENIEQDNKTIYEGNSTDSNIKKENIKMNTSESIVSSSDVKHKQESLNNFQLLQSQVGSWRVMLQPLPASVLRAVTKGHSRGAMQTSTRKQTSTSTVGRPQELPFFDYQIKYTSNFRDHRSGQKYDLECHMSLHSEEKPFKCRVCSHKFKLVSYLNKHMRKHTGEKPHKCELCKFQCSQKGNLKTHMRTHTGEKPYKCEICDYRSALMNNLKTHRRTHTKEKPFKCEICDKPFSESGSLKRHLILHTGEKPFKCELCSSSFALAASLTVHMKRHTGDKPHKCSVCEHRCVEKMDLVKHMRSHTGEKPHQCKLCYYKSSQLIHLKNHVKRAHLGHKPYKCEVCEYCSADKFSLKCHMVTHGSDRLYMCEFCDCSFKLRGTLRKHKITHTREKPFKCEVCDCRFKTSQHLKEHLKIHTGEKPYKCQMCDYRCTNSGALKTHMRTHTGEKPFKCKNCDYQSSYNGNLKTHMRTHSDEKPYKCEICDYRCKQSSHLKYHVTKHTGSKLYECDDCDYQCSHINTLKKHKNSHTGQELRLL